MIDPNTILLCYLMPAVVLFFLIICSDVNTPDEDRIKGRYLLSYSFLWPYHFVCMFIKVVIHTVVEVSKHLKKCLWDNF